MRKNIYTGREREHHLSVAFELFSKASLVVDGCHPVFVQLLPELVQLRKIILISCCTQHKRYTASRNSESDVLTVQMSNREMDLKVHGTFIGYTQSKLLLWSC